MKKASTIDTCITKLIKQIKILKYLISISFQTNCKLNTEPKCLEDGSCSSGQRTQRIEKKNVSNKKRKKVAETEREYRTYPSNNMWLKHCRKRGRVQQLSSCVCLARYLSSMIASDLVRLDFLPYSSDWKMII
ncbi:hypothetical protein ACOSQ3_016163 [Xanthoceras sorbifolium]